MERKEFPLGWVEFMKKAISCQAKRPQEMGCFPWLKWEDQNICVSSIILKNNF
jgi:hypothetical protein